MQYLRGWRALKADPQWMGKIGVGMVLMFVPVIGPIVLVGWQSLALRRAVSGQDSPLPRLEFDFDYMSKLLSVGFKGFLVRLLWQLPAMLISFIFGCTAYVGMFALIFSRDDTVTIAVSVVLGLAALLMPIVVVLVSMPMQIGIMRAEITDDIKAGMQLKEVFAGVKLVWKELFVGMIVLTMLSSIMIMCGMMAFYIGVFPVLVILGVIGTYFTAEVYRVYLEKGGEPLPIGPLDVPAPQPPHGYPNQGPPSY